MASLAQGRPVAFDEAFAYRALDSANLNALRLALFQAAGDQSLAEMHVVMERYRAGSYELASLASKHAQKVKEKAMAFLRSGASDGCPAPEDRALRAMMELFAGGKVKDYVFHLGKEELGLDEFSRGVEWKKEWAAQRRRSPIVRALVWYR